MILILKNYPDDCRHKDHLVVLQNYNIDIIFYMAVSETLISKRALNIDTEKERALCLIKRTNLGVT